MDHLLYCYTIIYIANILYTHMWESSGNNDSDGLSNSHRTGGDLGVEEEERRVLVFDTKNEDVRGKD